MSTKPRQREHDRVTVSTNPGTNVLTANSVYMLTLSAAQQVPESRAWPGADWLRGWSGCRSLVANRGLAPSSRLAVTGSRGLSIHVTRTHKVTEEEYLRHHQLDATQSPWLGRRPKPPKPPVSPAELDRRHQEQRRSVAHASAVRSDQARQRHEEKARALGYADLTDLLQSTAHVRQRDVATQLGVSATRIGVLRQALISPAQ